MKISFDFVIPFTSSAEKVKTLLENTIDSVVCTEIKPGFYKFSVKDASRAEVVKIATFVHPMYWENCSYISEEVKQ